MILLASSLALVTAAFAAVDGAFAARAPALQTCPRAGECGCLATARPSTPPVLTCNGEILTGPFLQRTKVETERQRIDLGGRAYGVHRRREVSILCTVHHDGPLPPHVDEQRSERVTSVEIGDPSRKTYLTVPIPQALNTIVHVTRIEGERGLGLLVEVTEAISDLEARTELIVLVQRGDTLVPLAATLKIIETRQGLWTEPFAVGATLLGQGETLPVVLQGSRFDPTCPVAVDWDSGLRLEREVDCVPGRASPTTGAEGTVVLYAAPSESAPSTAVEVRAGASVTAIRVHGTVGTRAEMSASFGAAVDPMEDDRALDAPSYGFPCMEAYGLAGEWVEVEIAGTRGWVYRPEDLDLLGFEVIDRC